MGLVFADLPFPLIVALAALAGLFIDLGAQDGPTDSPAADAATRSALLRRGGQILGVSVAIVAGVYLLVRAAVG
ncbi:MAG: hypothetical protein AAFR44_08005, partial [Pseudomonadota bacterium]